MDLDQLFAIWRSEHLPSLALRHELDGIIDVGRRRISWDHWIDALNKSGQISDSAVANMRRPDELETVRASMDDLDALRGNL